MEIIGNISTTESPITSPSSAIQNTGNTPSISADIFANIPAPGEAGRIFISSDSGTIFRDTGTGWTTLGTSVAAGATTQIQINNGGMLYADSSFTFDPSTDTLRLGGNNTNIIFNGITTEPAAPAAGTGRLYAKAVADRIVPKWIGPSGIDYILQGHIGSNNIRAWRGGATTAATTFASVFGTMPYTGASPIAPTIPALSATNLLTQINRSTISTSANARTIAYIRSIRAEVWRGDATGLGGFFVVARFALSGTLRAGLRCFAGLVDVVANPTNIDPTTTTAPGGIGLATNASTGNWKLVNNITGTARTSLDLGASFPINNTSPMELVLFSTPNGSVVSWRVTNLQTGVQTNGTLSTNIPANTTFLSPSVWVTNNVTAAAQTLDFISLYVETDF